MSMAAEPWIIVGGKPTFVTIFNPDNVNCMMCINVPSREGAPEK